MTAKPTERKYTSADLLALPDKRYELSNGEIVEVGTSSQKHSTLGAWLLFMLMLHITTNKLSGRVGGADGTYDLDQANTKAPDISYLTPESTAKIPPGSVFAPFGPDFVIEIKSPSDSVPAMHTLALLYIRTGSRLVWTIDYEEKTAKVYRPDQVQPQNISGDGVLDASEVIPGFKIGLPEMFAQIEGL